jgi:hypothetical protein
VPYTSSERVGACITLHPRVLVVGEYKLVAREGYVPGLGLGSEWRCTQSPEFSNSMCELELLLVRYELCARVLCLSPMGCPASPFIVTRGGRFLHV